MTLGSAMFRHNQSLRLTSMDAVLLPPPAVAEPTAERTALTSVTPMIESEVVTDTW